MIGFGLPVLLPLALLASLPAIIHIVSRARMRRLEFPTLRLIENVQRERVAWSRLKDILLLTLRTLALLTLLLVPARPHLRAGTATLDRPDLVLLIDDSYSLQYGTTWPRACSLAGRLVRGCPPDGRVVLRLASTPDAPVTAVSPATAARVLDTLQPSNAAARVVTALPAAARAADSLNAELLILTDLQRRSLAGDWRPAREGRARLLDVGSDATDNLALTGLAPDQPVVVINRSLTMQVAVNNHGPATEVATVRYDAGDVTDSPGPGAIIEIPAGQTRSVGFATRFARPGPHLVSARLVASPDSLAADNARYLAVDVRDSLRVLAVASDRVGAAGVRSALIADPSGITRVEELPREQLGRRDLRGYDAVVVLDALALDAADWTRLLFALAGGTGLVLMASPTSPDPTGLAHFARSAGTLTPGSLAIAGVDSLHPALAGIDPALWPSPRFRVITRLIADSARVLARFADGNPFLLEAADGRVLLWATGPTPEFTDLARRAAFVPLLVSSVDHVVAGGRAQNAIVGDTLRFPTVAVGPVYLAGPAGRSPINPSSRDGRAVYEQADTREPGGYRLIDAGTGNALAAAAVNVETGESNLERATPEELARHGVPVTSNIATGHDLTRWFLLLTAAAFAAELLLLLL